MMADNKPSYSLAVPGDGGRATVSGLIRRRTADEGGSGGCGGGFLDLSLGSIYNDNPIVNDDGGGFSAVAPALLPAAAATTTMPMDASVVPSVVVVAATAANAPLAPASRASVFPLGLGGASAVPVGDGNGGGHVRAARAVANPVPVLPPLFSSDGAAAVPVTAPVPVHGNASDIGATPPPYPSGGAVTLSSASPHSSAPPSPPNMKRPRAQRGNAATGRRRRRNRGAAGDDDDADAVDALAPANGGESAPPPFPWATKTAGAHPTLAELMERGIVSVDGEVRCKRCGAGKTISYDIRSKFEELSSFIFHNVEAMHDRAPPEWAYPALPSCDKCGQRNSLRPVIAAEKWRINWLFLLLGQTLGLCTLDQLKHFCARTRQHRTGAKDRVLYLTYMELCNQLCPGGPFDMASERKNRTRPFA